MGYTTDFDGRFELNKKLTPKLHDYLTKFSETRRMARKLPKEFGVEGEFYVDGGGDFGQDREPDIIDYNKPPVTQPGLWCQWVPSEDGMGIEWNGGEKFYNYVEWITYITENFLKPEGYVINGMVSWQGEDGGDVGVIEARNNEIIAHEGVIDLVTDSELDKVTNELFEILDVFNISVETRKKFLKRLESAINKGE